MSFGYSAGDFLAGANLTYQLITALSGTQYAFQEYQEALRELGVFQQVFMQVSRMVENPSLNPSTINAASHIVLSGMTLIEEFLAKTRRYRERLNGREAGTAMSDSWQKMGWVLFKKDELKALKEALHVKLTSVSLLIDTAKCYERAPDLVAAKEVASGPNPSPPPVYTPHITERSKDETLPTRKSKANDTLGTRKGRAEIKVQSRNRSQRADTESSSDEEPLKAIEDKTKLRSSDPLPPPVLPNPHSLGISQKMGLQNPGLNPSASVLSSQTMVHGGPPGPPPGPPSLMQRNAIWQNSMRTQDINITPPRIMDYKTCLERLTTFIAYTIRPRTSSNLTESSWARPEVTEERISQEDVAVAMKNPSDLRTVHDRIIALEQDQQTQVNALLGNLRSAERDLAFDWSFVHLDQTFKTSWQGKREVVDLTVYVTRSPRKDLDPITLFRNIQRMKTNIVWPPQAPQPPPELRPQPPPPPNREPVHILGKWSELKKAKRTGRKMNRKKDSDYDSCDTSSGSDSSDNESFKSFS